MDEKGGILDALQNHGRLARYVGRKLRDLRSQFFNAAHVSPKIVGIGDFSLGQIFHNGFKIRFSGQHVLQCKAAFALHDNRGAAVGHFYELQNARHGANLHKVAGSRIFHIHAFLGQNRNQFIGFVRVLHGFDALVAAYGYRQHHAGKQYGIAQRQHRDGAWKDGISFAVILALVKRNDGQKLVVVIGLVVQKKLVYHDAKAVFIVTTFWHLCPFEGGFCGFKLLKMQV